MSIKARLAAVKKLFEDEAAGYGLQYTAEQDSKIAILTIGYADGLPRSLSCCAGSVLINGSEAPIIGRICMDLTLVEITDISNVMQGDIAVIVGKSGEHEITVYDIAEQEGTITNEIRFCYIILKSSIRYAIVYVNINWHNSKEVILLRE